MKQSIRVLKAAMEGWSTDGLGVRGDHHGGFGLPVVHTSSGYEPTKTVGLPAGWHEARKPARLFRRSR
jgi:hypothetical protein